MEEQILERRFGNIDGDYAGPKKSKVFIIQAPYDRTLTYVKGAAKGPQAIIEASMNMELFDDELQTETYKIGIYTSPSLGLDATMLPEEAISKVKEAVTNVLQANKFPVLLGGGHSVTVGGVKAAKTFFNELSVLHLDAHYDLRDEYMDSRYNHACVARRIQEICPMVEIGARSLSKEEKDFLDISPSNVKTINVYDILETHDWKKKASRLLSDTVYITIDVDVLDPSLVPCVGTPEPGGLGWYEFIDFLKVITRDKKVIGFDVVELSPREGFIASDFLAAKLIYRLLGYIFINSKK